MTAPRKYTVGVFFLRLPKMAFKLKLKVRDYECDMADGVNNSVYYNYLEHARHEFLKSGGIDFAALAREKIGLVLIRAEIDFRASLVSGDEFEAEFLPALGRHDN